MKPWQWLALPCGLALLTMISVFPFAHYSDPENTWTKGTDEVGDSGSVQIQMEFKRGYGFLSVWRIRELNRHRVQLSSGGNAEPNWLVVLLLAASTALLSGFVLGHREATFRGRRTVLSNAIWGFVLLASSALGYSMVATDGFSWKLVLLSPLCTFGGLFLLWKSTTQRLSEVSAADERATNLPPKADDEEPELD